MHIPKTAGTSVHAMLDGAVLGAAAMARRGQAVAALGGIACDNDRGIYPKHGKAEELRRLVGTQVWDLAFKFTIVRNPWALMVSSYFWWLQRADRFPLLVRQAAEVKEMGGFRAFLRSGLGGGMINELPGTMSEWFSEEGRDLVDFIGRVESLEVDMQTVLTRLGATAGDPISRLNQSAHADYQDYYDGETKMLIASRFADVISRFEYRF